MSHLTAVLPAAITDAGTTSGGEAVLFWVLAPIMVLAALGLLFARKAVHAAMAVVAVMISLAFLYVAQEAPFLGVVQVVVYTGAVMMLFLFVLMLVGVDTGDSLVETIKGQRWIGLLGGAAVAFLLIGSITGVSVSLMEATLYETEGLSPAGQPGLLPDGLETANADGNPVGVAREVFGEELQRDGLAEREVVGPVDLAHPAAAQRADDAVPPGQKRARRLRPLQRGRHPGAAARRQPERALGLARAGRPRSEPLGRPAGRPGRPGARRDRRRAARARHRRHRSRRRQRQPGGRRGRHRARARQPG